MTTEEKIKLIDEAPSFADIPPDAMPPSYRENYYFISYSHKDYKTVLKDILRLEEMGIPIWYDAEMHIGENWQEIAQLYISRFQCAGVIFYLTENSISSPACNQEVEYVLTHHKHFLSVNQPLEGCALQSGHEMLLEMKRRGLPCSDDLLDNFRQAFPNEILYLGIDESIERKARQISAIPKEDLLMVEKRRSSFSVGEHLTVAACRDNSILAVDLSKIYDSDGFSGELSEIDDCVFTNSTKLQQVRVAAGLKRIGESTFRNCAALREIDLSKTEGLRIEKSGFQNCPELTEVDLSRVSYIGEKAFAGCLVFSVGQINGQIGSMAFAGTALGRVQYVAENPQLDRYAFWQCAGLQQLDITGVFRSDIGENAFYDCQQLEQVGPFRAPWDLSWRDNVCFTVGSGAFSGCRSLEQVHFSGLWSFEKATWCFARCYQLRLLDLDIKQTEIPDSFASGCSMLSDVLHAERITAVGKEAFSECQALKALDLSGVQQIGEAAFFNTGLLKVYLNRVQHIGRAAFSSCTALTQLYIGEECRKIEQYAFYNCISLQTVKIMSEQISISLAGNVFGNRKGKIETVYLRCRAVLELLEREDVLPTVQLLYIGVGVDTEGISLANFCCVPCEESGFTKWQRQGVENVQQKVAFFDPDDPLLLAPMTEGKRPETEVILPFFGKEVTIRHKKVRTPFQAFLQQYEMDEQGRVAKLLLSLHDCSVWLDTSLVDGMEEAPLPTKGYLTLPDKGLLLGRTCCFVWQGKMTYAVVEEERLLSPCGDGSLPLASVILCEDEGAHMALCGLDIDAITVFNDSFEAENSFKRESE